MSGSIILPDIFLVQGREAYVKKDSSVLCLIPILNQCRLNLKKTGLPRLPEAGSQRLKHPFD